MMNLFRFLPVFLVWNCLCFTPAWTLDVLTTLSISPPPIELIELSYILCNKGANESSCGPGWLYTIGEVICNHQHKHSGGLGRRKRSYNTSSAIPSKRCIVLLHGSTWYIFSCQGLSNTKVTCRLCVM